MLRSNELKIAHHSIGLIWLLKRHNICWELRIIMILHEKWLIYEICHILSHKSWDIRLVDSHSIEKSLILTFNILLINVYSIIIRKLRHLLRNSDNIASFIISLLQFCQFFPCHDRQEPISIISYFSPFKRVGWVKVKTGSTLSFLKP